MKKRMFVFLLLFAVLAATPCFASEYHTIGEVREQAEVGWHQTYTVNGHQIAVDVGPQIPAVDALPVVKVNYALFPSQTAPTDGAIRYELITPARTLIRKDFDTPEKVVPETEARFANALAMKAAQAPENPLAFGDAIEIAKAKLMDIGINPDDFDLDNPYELQIHGYYAEKTHEPALPGSYYFFARQKHNGIPILMNAGDAYLSKTTRCFCPQVICNVRSSDSWHILVETVVEDEVVAADIPLCSFQTVVETIEAEILSGNIGKVYSLEFGYIVYDDPTSARVDGFAGLSESYYLAPGWVVSCLYNQGKQPTSQVDDFQREADGYLTALINAQSGEMVDCKYNKKDKADYRGFMTWDEARMK